MAITQLNFPVKQNNFRFEPPNFPVAEWDELNFLVTQNNFRFEPSNFMVAEWMPIFLPLKRFNMRTLLKVTMDTATSNKSVLDGSLPKMLQQTMEQLKPEASYFFPSDGCRCCIMVFDLKDASEIPVISEPFFFINAKVEFCPVMNADDLKKGLGQLQSTKTLEKYS